MDLSSDGSRALEIGPPAFSQVSNQDGYRPNKEFDSSVHTRDHLSTQDDDDDDVFDIQGKHRELGSLQRWKKATLVLNAARRFRYTASVDQEQQRQKALRQFRATAHAIRAVNLFLKAGGLDHRSLALDDDNFALKPEELVSLVQEHQAEVLVKKLGDVEGVMRLLKTDPDKGISNDPAYIEARTKAYGSNTYIRQPPKPFWAFIIDACKDLTLIILMVCAVASLVLSMKTEGVRTGWHDGVAISFAVIIVILVTSISDYRQSLQFSALNEEKRNIQVEVIRDGRRQDLSIFQIVVGDIVLLSIGDQVPADGLLVDGHSLHIDQSGITGESEPTHVHRRMPFLSSGGKVDDGQGMMVVTAVGMLTEWGQLMAAIGEDTGEETPLQVRLNGVATLIGKVGLTVASSVLVILIIFYFVGHTEGVDSSGKFKAGQTSGTVAFNSVVKIFAIAVTIVVVAVPEGLPLAVTLSLAYAMKKMMADKALVRRLSACETMGCATTICSDKTGTLTLNQMTVVKSWICGARINNSRDESIGPEDNIIQQEGLMDEHYRNILLEGIVQNSTGSIFVPDKSGGEPELTGSATEKAALLWGLKLGMDYAMVKSLSRILQVESFNSTKKRAGVAVQAGDEVRVHWKGAAEIIVEECDKMMSSNNTTIPITSDEISRLMREIEGMASEGLRCIAFAYMDVDPEDIPSGDEMIEDWEIPSGPNLTLLAIVGIKDPCRPEVREAVKRCQAAGIKVRMVTGDNLMTAKAISVECGILQDGDLAIEGREFRNYSNEERKQHLPSISILARSSPSDKLLMVRTLREMGEVVAVTGDGTNDAPAIREADVGLAMGIQGTEVAKESSDIVIMDDNFASVVKVVRWGRSIYRNIQKFIQFQLTVNVAALSINFVAAVSSGEVPLTAVQLLWVNLIMDTLGALALATERPTDNLLDVPPVGRREPLISNVMWRNIFFQALYQLAILLALQFKGEKLMGLSGVPNASQINRTVIFNAFVFCQLFNEVNARKLEDKNVFQGIFTNWLFVGIIGVTVVMQIVIVEFLNSFASTVKLSWKYWLISIGIGSVSWPIAFAAKFVPIPERPILYMGMSRIRGRRRAAREPDVQSTRVPSSTKMDMPPPATMK